MPAEARSLHRKLAQVMYEAERIPKNGRAPKEMGGYPFVQVGDAADFIRKALAEKVVTMMPVAVRVIGQVDRPTAKGGTMTTLDLVTTWRITDGESGEFIDIESFGAGADVGDKYSGKASTSAMKYALLTGFLLSTGEDSELGKDQPVEPIAVPPPSERTDDGGLIGTVELSKDSPDFLPRQGPGGAVLTFKLTSPHGGIKVIAYDPIASVLVTQKADVIGKRVTCWGRIEDETYRPKGAKRDIVYQVLQLERIQTPDFILPVASDEVPPIAPGQVPLDMLDADERLIVGQGGTE